MNPVTGMHLAGKIFEGLQTAGLIWALARGRGKPSEVKDVPPSVVGVATLLQNMGGRRSQDDEAVFAGILNSGHPIDDIHRERIEALLDCPEMKSHQEDFVWIIVRMAQLSGEKAAINTLVKIAQESYDPDDADDPLGTYGMFEKVQRDRLITPAGSPIQGLQNAWREIDGFITRNWPSLTQRFLDHRANVNEQIENSATIATLRTNRGKLWRQLKDNVKNK